MKAQAAGEGLLHPLVIASVGLLVMNDHWAKALWPGVVTGKLSDFAGLLFFPFLLQAAWELLHALLRKPWSPSQRVLSVAAIVTAAVFAAVKLWPPAAELYRIAFGTARWPLDALVASLRGQALPGWSKVCVTRDPTDLVALLSIAVALVLGTRRSPARVASGAPGKQPPT